MSDIQSDSINHDRVDIEMVTEPTQMSPTKKEQLAKQVDAERVSISIALLNDVVSVLSSMPYKNVANIMDALQRDIRQI
jgi:hypothetical protein